MTKPTYKNPYLKTYDNQTHQVWSPNGFELSEQEKYNIEKFITEHKEKHGSCPYTITFDSTSGIGISVFIVCKECGEYRDITDYSTW